MPDEKMLELGEVYFGNWLVMRAELTDEELREPCARCTFARECHIGDGATCPPATIEGLLCPGFTRETPH
jgi:hypothetical protein